jgi:hypothetical protein
VAIPKQLAEILDQTSAKRAAAAMAQFKDLRKQHFGAQAYDFSEGSLVNYAQRATNANKADDAIAWLQLNLDYYRCPPDLRRALAGAAEENDEEAAIKSLREGRRAGSDERADQTATRSVEGAVTSRPLPGIGDGARARR